MTFLAPAVYVQESPFLANPTSSSSPTQSTAVFVGAHPQGPLTATFVRTWAQFSIVYGGFTGQVVPSQLALGVYTFFQNGGPGCSVLRVAHADAAVATTTFNGAGAVATLTVKAVNAGVWGNSITVILTPNVDTIHFNAAVYFTGLGGTQLAEPIWVNLSMLPSDSNYAPNVINSPVSGSGFITVTDLAVAPLVTPGPVPVAATAQLASGTNGSTVTTADLTATTAALNSVKNPMLLNFPGITDVSNVLNAMATYCQTGRTFADSILYIDPPAASTVSAMEAYVATIPDTSYALTYYPWITITDPSTTTKGILRTIPPCAAVMALTLVTDVNRGVQKAPAGAATIIAALGIERDLLEADIGNLTAAGVNCIRALPTATGTSVVVWGARTLAPTGSLTQYINVRRTLIYIEANLKRLTLFAIFEDNGYALWQQVSYAANSFLNQFWAGGGLANATAATSYYVICDDTINSVPSNTVNLQVGVAPSEPAEFVLISISQFSGGTTVTDTSV